MECVAVAPDQLLLLLAADEQNSTDCQRVVSIPKEFLEKEGVHAHPISRQMCDGSIVVWWTNSTQILRLCPTNSISDWSCRSLWDSMEDFSKGKGGVCSNAQNSIVACVPLSGNGNSRVQQESFLLVVTSQGLLRIVRFDVHENALPVLVLRSWIRSSEDYTLQVSGLQVADMDVFREKSNSVNLQLWCAMENGDVILAHVCMDLAGNWSVKNVSPPFCMLPEPPMSVGAPLAIGVQHVLMANGLVVVFLRFRDRVDFYLVDDSKVEDLAVGRSLYLIGSIGVSDEAVIDAAVVGVDQQASSLVFLLLTCSRLWQVNCVDLRISSRTLVKTADSCRKFVRLVSIGSRHVSILDSAISTSDGLGGAAEKGLVMARVFLPVASAVGKEAASAKGSISDSIESILKSRRQSFVSSKELLPATIQRADLDVMKKAVVPLDLNEDALEAFIGVFDAWQDRCVLMEELLPRLVDQSQYAKSMVEDQVSWVNFLERRIDALLLKMEGLHDEVSKSLGVNKIADSCDQKGKSALVEDVIERLQRIERRVSALMESEGMEVLLKRQTDLLDRIQRQMRSLSVEQ